LTTPHQLGPPTWDSDKIKCFLTSKERDDVTLMRSLVDGSNVEFASRFYPLIFNANLNPGSELAALRSLPFLRRLVSNDAGALDEYRCWSDDRRSHDG